MTTKSPILIVEDNEIAAKILKTRCLRAGCAVDHATGVRVASKLILEKSYELIFMDLGLVDGDGRSLVHWIRTEENPNQKTIIIVVSAHMDNDLKQACLHTGANSVFVKPISQAIIDRLLNDT